MAFLKRNKNNKDTNTNNPPATNPALDGTAASANNNPDAFAARRSNRIGREQFSKSDGDTWQETFAVCEQAAERGGHLAIRSYYTNQRTSQRVWDEPPSGASKIIQASDEMRKMAELQLSDMQIITNTSSSGNDKEDSHHESSSPPTTTTTTTTQPRKGLFRRKESRQTSTSSSDGGASSTSGGGQPPKPRIQYKKNSLFSKHAKMNPKLQKKKGDDSLDPDLQKAIALSMGASYENPAGGSGGGPRTMDDDEDMAMAKALSMSEQPANSSNSGVASASSNHVSSSSATSSFSEMEALRVALEESYKEVSSTSGTSGCAAVAAPASPQPPQQYSEGDLLGLGAVSQQSSSEMDQKMPATTTTQPPTPPSTPYNTNSATEATTSGSGVKTWPPPPNLGKEEEEDYGGLQKMVGTEDTKKPTKINKLSRRLQKKKDVQDQAGLV